MVIVKTRLLTIIASVRKTFVVEIARYWSIRVNRIHVEKELAKVTERSTIVFVALATQEEFVMLELIIAKRGRVKMVPVKV